MVCQQFGEAPFIHRAENPIKTGAEDPAVAAFERWRQAREAELAFYRTYAARPDGGWERDPAFLAAEQTAIDAERALANSVPTTPAGLAAQVRFAFRIFGELRPDRLGIDPDDYHELGGLEGGGGAELLRNMLAGAERMAGETPDR